MAASLPVGGGLQFVDQFAGLPEQQVVRSVELIPAAEQLGEIKIPAVSDGVDRTDLGLGCPGQLSLVSWWEDDRDQDPDGPFLYKNVF